jgi:pimeloyl-ACP methyl ester carboxylesterase
MNSRRLLRKFLLVSVVLLVLVLVGGTASTLLINPASVAPDLPARVAEPASRFVTVPLPGTDGIEVHYLEAGERAPGKTAFVLLHGFTFNAFTWDAQLARFAERGATIAIDQLPYGLSPKLTPADWRGANPYARAAAVELVLGVMDSLDVERAVVVGNSSGGTLALELALAAPERVAGLVLVAPWVYVHRPVIPRAIAESLPLRRLSLFIARQLGEHGGLLELSFADTERISPERRRLAALHTRTRNWDLAWAELLKQSLSTRIEVGARLAEVRQPVLVVTGDADRLVPPADSRRVAAELPHADLEVLAGCGHVPHEECPEAFAAVVERWLTQTPLSLKGFPGAVYRSDR